MIEKQIQELSLLTGPDYAARRNAFLDQAPPLPDYPTGRPRVTVVHYEVAPHARLALHRHPVINAGMVLRGELTVVADDGRERSFRAGEGVIEMVGRLHYGENRGEEPVELVMVYAGSDGLPLSEPAE